MKEILPIVQHLVQLLLGDAGVLGGVVGVGVAQLPLHGGDVAGLVDDVPAHGMARRVRGLPFHAGDGAEVVPELVDQPGLQSPGAAGVAGSGQEEGGRGREGGGIGTVLGVEVVADGVQALAADLVAVSGTALLLHGDCTAVEVDIAEVEVGDCGATHAGLDQRVDDRPVAPGPVVLPLRPLVGLGAPVAVAVLAAATDEREGIGGIEQLLALLHGEGALDLEAVAL